MAINKSKKALNPSLYIVYFSFACLSWFEFETTLTLSLMYLFMLLKNDIVTNYSRYLELASFFYI